MDLSAARAPVRKLFARLRNARRRAAFFVTAGADDSSGHDARQWVRYYRSIKRNPHVVLYQTHSGSAMSCNPYAIFRELLDDPKFAHLEHVWVLDSVAELARRRAEYAHRPNVRFVRFKTDEYRKALATATYLIQNAVFPAYFTKRPGQVYVNSWHSAGAVKRMGFDAPRGNLVSRNVLRDLMMADYLISPNALTTRMYADSYRLRGLYGGCLLQLGYPRNDTLLTASRAQVIDDLRSRGVEIDPQKKIVLYAPTWRGTIGNVRAGTDELEKFRNALHERIDTDEYQVLVKPHTFHYNRLTDEQKQSGRYVPRHVNANALLAAVDVLVSDYSSIFFDFMLTDRPILFYVPDLADYTAERGLYFTPDELPGPVTDDAATIAEWINDLGAVSHDCAERYARLKAMVCAGDDGHAAKRTVDAVFRGEAPEGAIVRLDDPGLTKVLIHAAELDDHGDTEAVLALAAGLDPAHYDVSVACGEAKASRANIERLTTVRVFVRAAGSALLPNEARALGYLSRHGPDVLVRRMNLQPVLEREWRRRFGDAQFDVIVDASRRPGLFAWMARQNTQGALLISRPTDVAAELDWLTAAKPAGGGDRPLTRGALTALYRAADAVVVPSSHLLTRARAAFPTVTFVAAEAMIDPDRVPSLLNQARAWRDEWRVRPSLIVADVSVDANATVHTAQLNDSAPAPDSGEPYRRFVTMGELSPKQNLVELIAAFADFVGQHPNSRLFVVGGGPMLAELRQLTAGPELGGRVCFTGQLRNPFTVLDQADCFVLPSTHEGYSLAVAEARQLGLPIVLARFASAPSVMVPEGQYLTGFTAAELFDGLQAFVAGRVPTGSSFDVKAHNASAAQQWNVVLAQSKREWPPPSN